MKKEKFKVRNICIIILLLLVALAVYLVIDGEIEKNLNISLNGDSNIVLNYGDTYEELGASAKYEKKDLTNTIKTESNLDLDHIGKYVVKYSIEYKKKKKTIERKIEVVDNEKPSILLNGTKEFISIGTAYNELGATAQDNYDGDITNNIEIDTTSIDINKVGNYKAIYKVKDSSGNEAIVEREIIVTNSLATQIPVLNYHFFYEKPNECTEALCENIATFKKQLDYLRDNNYYTVTIDEFTKWMYGEIELPEKSILITVDDGAYGTSKINGNYLIPTLEEYKMHATLFLITGWWDIENYQSDYLDVQSHTNDLHYEASCGHRSKINCVSYDTLLSDLKKSIEIVKDASSFCFPFYDYTEQSIKAVKEAGFKIAFVGGRRKATRSDDKYKIPRYPIYDYTSMDSFISMIS